MTLLSISVATVQEVKRSEVSVQGTGVFTTDYHPQRIRSTHHAFRRLLTSYRFHLNRWLAADGSYGYTRSTQQTFTSSWQKNPPASFRNEPAEPNLESPRF